MKFLFTCAAALMLFTGAAQALTYTEAVDGDLSGLLELPGDPLNEIFDLTDGSTLTVNGSLDGGASSSLSDGSDEFDIFQFTVAGGFELDLSQLSGVDVFAGLYVEDGFGSFGFTTIRLAGTDIFSDLADFGAGIYAVVAVPSSNMGIGSYSITVTPDDIAPIPLPAGLPLLASGFGLLLFAKRRRAAS